MPKENGKKDPVRVRGRKMPKENGKKDPVRVRGRKMTKENGKKDPVRGRGRKMTKEHKGKDPVRGRALSRNGGNGGNSGRGRSGTRQQNIQDRQTGDTCFADMVAKTKKFNAAQTNGRMVTRMTNWKNVMINKKNSSSSTFKDSLDAMTESTGNGTSCGGKGMDKESKDVFDKLKSCAKTAASKCDLSAAINETLMMKCNASLTTFTKAFKDCLNKVTAEACTCVQGLTEPGADCLKFKSMNDAVKKQKKKCTGGKEAGSFSDCRKQERLAAKFGNKCKVGCKGMMTTKKPSSGRLNILSNLKKNIWKN